MQKPQKNINLFDVQASQAIIGQDKFLEAFKTILNHGGYCQGKETAELDEKLAKYSGVKNCLTCASGTDALLLPLLTWGIKPGDAVFVPSWTFVATAEVVVLLGATPVFVDSDENSWNMDPKDLEKAIAEIKAEGKLTPKAVISVDIFGNPCEYDSIAKIAKDNNLKFLSDACQSYGAEYKGKRIGALADATATSFYPTKPLGCYGDGGATFTNCDNDAGCIKSCRVHGMSTEDRYDNIRVGVTGRMDSFQAAVLLQKLTVFEKEMADRQVIAKFYNDNLSKYFVPQSVAPNTQSAWALYTITCQDRDGLQKHLQEKGVPCGAYYPRPVHTQTAYKEFNKRSLPVCDKLSKTVLSIPMHPYLTNEELEYIVYCMNEFANK